MALALAAPVAIVAPDGSAVQRTADIAMAVGDDGSLSGGASASIRPAPKPTPRFPSQPSRGTRTCR